MPGFTYRICGPFTRNKRRTQEFKEIEDSRYIYQNELGKACFQHDIVYGYFQYLARETVFDKLLRDKAFNIAKNPRFDRYQRRLASMVYKFFNKNYSGRYVTRVDKSAIKSEIMTSQHPQNLALDI